ncbi:MAG TPA: hypothetical protein VHX38_05520 [Pseudonocardiaceae bacterium]|jgi:hypothetical protein|nr:hypothetical protein [Pseudonocardiaceae bacterium]
MARTKLLVDATTKSKLGAELLAELSANLWAMDCQSCGMPLRWWTKPALAVQVVGDLGRAALHHRRCQPEGWQEYPAGADDAFTRLPHISWRGGLMRFATDDVLVFLVNPYAEVATLRRKGAAWHAATLDLFSEVGMGPEFLDAVFPQPALSVLVDEDRISAQVTDGAGVEHNWHISPISPGVRRAADKKEWLTIAVSTLLDPRKPFPMINVLPMLVATGQIRLGAARRFYTERAQRLRLSDVDQDRSARQIDLVLPILRTTLRQEIRDELLTAVTACRDGDATLIAARSAPDRRVGAVVIAQPYATTARTASGQPAHGGGVHVLAADAAEVEDCHALFARVAEHTGQSLTRLADEPTAQQRAEDYRADVVIGTPERFRAAYAFYRDDREDWSLHETRGRLAVVLGTEVRERAGDLIRRYPRVAVI